MAGDEDPNRGKDPSESFYGHNPFVAFRRFADEQISSMLQSVMGLPSVVTPPDSNRWTIFDGHYRDSNFRLRRTSDGKEEEYFAGSGTGAARDADTASTQDDKFSSTNSGSRWPGSEDPWHSHHHRKFGDSPSDSSGIDSFFDSFFDRFWFNDNLSSRFFHPYHQPVFNMLTDDSSTWPVAYLMFSPYSPLFLERQAYYRANRDRGVFSSLMSSLSHAYDRDPAEPQWREAFEDLLRLENGKPMLDREPTDISKKETGRDWLQGLVQRGSLGDHWKYVSETAGQPWSGIALESSNYTENGRHESGKDSMDRSAKTEISWKDNESESATELDMYDRFLDDLEARERELFTGANQSSLLRFLLEDRQRLIDKMASSENEDRNDDNESWIELVSGGNRNSVPETTAPQATPDSSSVDTRADKPYVISTKTTMERVQLSDGSIQSKTVKTKRFSDGREENSESVEVVNPPQPKQGSGDQDAPENSQKKKGGWFWKD